MKARITVSVSSELVRELDRVGRRRGAASRSANVEYAIALLVRQERAREIEESVARYYDEMSPEERQEDDSMVRAFNRLQRRLEVDEPTVSSPRPRPPGPRRGGRAC